MLEKPLACILSAFIPGTNPPYPGIAVFFGYTEDAE
jgi:hypothetical protein